MADDVVTVDPMDNPDLALDADMLGDMDGPFPFVDADGLAISWVE